MFNTSFAVVVSSSSTLLPTRGIWILSTYAMHVPTFVIVDDAQKSRNVVSQRPCSTIGTLIRCKWTSLSSVVLVPGCGGLERHGCCRVFSFLREAPPTHDWVAFVDDDVYVPDCLPKHLPIFTRPLFAPAKHVGARGGWRWSLCGEKGRPDTEIALPAGYGFANRALVTVLVRQASSMIRQCAATPSYNIDVALSFASWRYGAALTAVFDWTDPRVNWAGGQLHHWRADSWIFHKVRKWKDFRQLDYKRHRMCGVSHNIVNTLFAEQHAQTGYKQTRHAQTPSLHDVPFDCQ